MTDTAYRAWTEPPFVGRAAVVAEVGGVLARARAGRARLVIIEGEAGIGKTALAERVAGQAGDGGYSVRSARGWPGGGAPALWPWMQLIDDDSVLTGGDSAGQDPASARRDSGCSACMGDTQALVQGGGYMPTIDEAKVEQFMHQIVGELGVGLSGVLIHLGDRLGLYRAMGDSAPVTSAKLAARTGLAERYVREWLHNQAAAGWVTYDPQTSAFTLPPEHALLVADPDSPAYLLGGFDFIASGWADEDALADAFTTGAGIGWHQHDDRLFSGTERFFGPGYRQNLVAGWLPALDGVVARLEEGIRVADVGCGHGAATILLGQAYPQSAVTGYDYHDASVAAARARAAEAGADKNVSFEVASAKEFPGSYDLICLFDCLHDMGDPIGAARHIRGALAPGGTLMLVEPVAADRPEDNHAYPLGRLFYAASTAICMPGSLAQEPGLGLGNQVGMARWTELLTQAGFSSVRLATSTPVNLIIEARA